MFITGLRNLVKDQDDGLQMPGVSVLLKGTTTGMVTGLDE